MQGVAERKSGDHRAAAAAVTSVPFEVGEKVTPNSDFHGDAQHSSKPRASQRHFAGYRPPAGGYCSIVDAGIPIVRYVKPHVIMS